MILIIGTPGAGKTTQTKLLAEYLGCPWFSTGELIRQKATGKDRQDMLAGKIIDDEPNIKIVADALAGLDLIDNECVFEGNPRSVPQAEWWLKKASNGDFKITAVFHLSADLQAILQRLKKRGRLDDLNVSVINERFSEYRRSIKPVLDYLKNNQVSVYEVNSNPPIEQVQAKIRSLIKSKDDSQNTS